LKRLKVFGSDNIGLYIKASNSFFLYHSSIPDKKIREVESELETIPVPVYLINTLILSPFIVCNNNGVILPYLFEEYAKEELVRRLKNLDINIGVIKEKYTSLGNLVLANDKGAIVSPILSLSARKMIADTLDIEVISSTIGRFSYVGSMAVSNNNGVLASPVAKDDEIRMIEDVLKVSLYTGTINGGIEFVSSGIVANDNGVVVGSSTTGRELMIISQAFGVD
jgi:translation initiation factor 6